MLDKLIAALDIRLVVPGRSGTSPVDLSRVRITDLAEDSRVVRSGSLFIARRGSKADGRSFVPAAAAAGAVAILTDDPNLPAPPPHPIGGPVMMLVTESLPQTAALLAERFFGSPTSRLKLVGATGTNGKTTITWLVHQLLNASGLRCGLIGTVLVDDGVQRSDAVLTTPPAIDLSRTLARMVDHHCRAAAIEASSHALHQSRTAALQFAIGIFSNLTHDHLDYHRTMEAYADAKALLFESLPQTATAIVNAQDPAHKRMIRDCKASVLRCGVMDATRGYDHPAVTQEREALYEQSDCRAIILERHAHGQFIQFSGPWSELELTLPMIGDHNAMNALQAMVAAHTLGVPTSVIQTALAAVASPPGRLEPVHMPGAPAAVYVDYAHTDDALQRVLQVARGAASAARGRVHVVVGCGGDRDPAKRPKMARAAAQLADGAIFTSDNPRTEDPRKILDQMLGGVPEADRSKVFVEPDRRVAIHTAVSRLAQGDVLIIAGKGHETYQIMPDGKGGTVTNHFDDREVAREALAIRQPSARL